MKRGVLYGAANPAWKGGRGTRSDGYVHVKTEREHRLIAEKVLGRPLPRTAEVHHVNGDKTDNRHSNLVICEDHAYHALLHRRTKVVMLGGNPDIERFCGKCRSLQALTNFASNAAKGDKKDTICKPCRNSINKSARAARLVGRSSGSVPRIITYGTATKD